MDPNHIAVITGDFVKSRNLSQELLDRGMQALENASNELYGWRLEDFGARSRQVADKNSITSANTSKSRNGKPKSASKIMKFSRIEGDSWRTVLKEPRLLYRALLFLIASLRAVDEGKQLFTRFSIGIGSGETDVADLNSANGDAYVESGSALQSLKRDAIVLSPKENTPLELSAALRLTAFMSQSWTARQAKALRGMLEPNEPTQRYVAANLGTTPQDVSDALASIDYGTLSQIVHELEDSL